MRPPATIGFFSVLRPSQSLESHMPPLWWDLSLLHRDSHHRGRPAADKAAAANARVIVCRNVEYVVAGLAERHPRCCSPAERRIVLACAACRGFLDGGLCF